MRTLSLLAFVVTVLACSFAHNTNGQDVTDRLLEPKAAVAVVDAFKAALEERWSYRYANRADFDAATVALRKRIEIGTGQSQRGLSRNETRDRVAKNHCPRDRWSLGRVRF